jgi:hypothetical protein
VVAEWVSVDVVVAEVVVVEKVIFDEALLISVFLMVTDGVDAERSDFLSLNDSS